ncbi:hypothetical protein os4_20690 [Comamonadaceae bacterium OS-4]|nr:hypothetical protein os4_20690 [Comamonadaceae bacterium OS-4]
MSISSRPIRINTVKNEQGVVLIIVLILLLVTSIVSSMSIRGASSSEQISNQTRLRSLAQQAAEGALRFCEGQVQLNALDGTKGFLPQAAPVGAPLTYTWESMSNWDAIDAGVNAFVGTGNLKPVEFKALSDDGKNMIYFKRQPECMAQYLAVADTKVFVTTARGFGPEVGAKDGNPPKGTEVWLQSIVTMK